MQNILVISDDNSDIESLSVSANINEKEIFVASESQNPKTNIIWNKASPISARSVVYKAEETLKEIHKVIIIFNKLNFASMYDKFNSENITKAYDSMLLGYNYLVSELLTKFTDNTYSSGDFKHIIFLLRSDRKSVV